MHGANSFIYTNKNNLLQNAAKKIVTQIFLAAFSLLSNTFELAECDINLVCLCSSTDILDSREEHSKCCLHGISMRVICSYRLWSTEGPGACPSPFPQGN